MSDALRLTPLHALHQQAGAKFGPFAGYDMPIQYPLGIKQEHLHTRQEAGLFDVSHMGQVKITGEQVGEFLETLVPANILGLKLNQCRYTLLTNDQGGVIDDLIITRLNDGFGLVINAGCKDKDLAYLRDKLPASCQLQELDDHALLALQGPKAADVITSLALDTSALTFMHGQPCQIGDVDCYLTRTGYTGEDGFEISVPAAGAEVLAKRLLAHEAVEWVGLGARDTLRLEAGLCLYGHELAADITPIEAALNWSIPKLRRPGGERAGGYPGAKIIAEQLENGTPRQRVGFKPDGRAPVRDGALIVTADGSNVGSVCSGTYSPSLGHPIVMAYIDSPVLQQGLSLYANVRGKQIPLVPQSLPFVAPSYRR